MPPLPDPPNPTIRFDLNWTIGGDVSALNRLFFTFSGGRPSGLNMNALCGSVLTVADGHFDALMSTATTLDAVTGTDITTTTGAEGAASPGNTGTRVGTPPPAGACVLVSHTIGTRYRGGKPRTYLPLGVAEDLDTTLLWKSALIGAVDSAWGGFISSLIGETAGTTTLQTYVALSYYDGVNPPVTLPSGRVKQSSKVRTVPLQYDITGHVTKFNVASQRRRNRNA